MLEFQGLFGQNEAARGSATNATPGLTYNADAGGPRMAAKVDISPVGDSAKKNCEHQKPTEKDTWQSIGSIAARLAQKQGGKE